MTEEGTIRNYKLRFQVGTFVSVAIFLCFAVASAVMIYRDSVSSVKELALEHYHDKEMIDAKIGKMEKDLMDCKLDIRNEIESLNGKMDQIIQTLIER